MVKNEELARYFESRKDDVSALVPIPARVKHDADTIYSIRFKKSEMELISARAREHGMRISAFIREAALTAALGNHGSREAKIKLTREEANYLYGLLGRSEE